MAASYPKRVNEKQAQDGRLAEALRELAKDFDNIGDIELESIGETKCYWPANNIKDMLHRAADRLETLTLIQLRRE